jgi:hypothetical protein
MNASKAREAMIIREGTHEGLKRWVTKLGTRLMGCARFDIQFPDAK